MQARKMLVALGICDMELVTWVQPRAKAVGAANAAAGAGAAVKAEATTGSSRVEVLARHLLGGTLWRDGTGNTDGHASTNPVWGYML